MFLHLIVLYRWVRLTTRRYGFRALFTPVRPRHGGVGRGLRINPLGRQHDDGGFVRGISAMYLVRQLQLERSLVSA
jgi:hypothetical protein